MADGQGAALGLALAQAGKAFDGMAKAHEGVTQRFVLRVQEELAPVALLRQAGVGDGRRQMKRHREVHASHDFEIFVFVLHPAGHDHQLGRRAVRGIEDAAKARNEFQRTGQLDRRQRSRHQHQFEVEQEFLVQHIVPGQVGDDRFGITPGASQAVLGMQRSHPRALVVRHFDRHGAQQAWAVGQLAVLYPFAGGALMIKVQQYGTALVLHRIGGGQVGGDGALADPALLAGDQDFLRLHVV